MRAALAFVAMTVPALAQSPGWSYSPLKGEGDRAAMGCGHESDATTFTCLVVRCEDDYSVGLHIHTSRAGGDAGGWRMGIDREASEAITAAADDSPLAPASPATWQC